MKTVSSVAPQQLSQNLTVPVSQDNADKGKNETGGNGTHETGKRKARKDGFVESADGKILSSLMTYRNDGTQVPLALEGGYYAIDNQSKAGGIVSNSLRIVFKEDNPILSMGTEVSYVFGFLLSKLVSQNKNDDLKTASKDIKPDFTFNVQDVQDFCNLEWKEAVSLLREGLTKIGKASFQVEAGDTHEAIIHIGTPFFPKEEEEAKRINHSYGFIFDRPFLEAIKHDVNILLLPQQIFWINRNTFRYAFNIGHRAIRRLRQNLNNPQMKLAYFWEAAGLPSGDEIKISQNKTLPRWTARFLKNVDELERLNLVKLKFMDGEREITHEELAEFKLKRFSSMMQIDVRIEPLYLLPMKNLKDLKTKHITRRRRAAAKKRAKNTTEAEK